MEMSCADVSTVIKQGIDQIYVVAAGQSPLNEL